MSVNGPIKIVFVTPFIGGGGAERVMTTVLANLDRERFSPACILFSRMGPDSVNISPEAVSEIMASETFTNMPVHDIERPRLRQAVLPLLKKIRELKPDILVSSLTNTNLAILALMPFLPSHTRVIIRESSLPSRSLRSLRFSRLLRFGYRLFYRHSHHVICQTRMIAHDLHENFGVPEKIQKILPNPVSVSAIRSSGTPIRYPGSGPRFVASGRMVPVKGFDRLLDLFARLPSDSHLTILGYGIDAEKLERQSLELGLTDQVFFAGFVTNPGPYYAGADAFLLPSLWEGMPNAANEALACGTPVIATSETGGLHDVARLADEGAITFADFDEEFLSAMKSVIARDSQLPKPCLLPPDFDVSRIVARFSDFFEECREKR